MSDQVIRVATRGSALALAQSGALMERFQSRFSEYSFELTIIKTTGDKLQTASMSNPGASLPKGLFTKEIEEALLSGDADMAVHSLKDLPTELPDGLILGCIPARVDPRDVLVVTENGVSSFEAVAERGALATSSVRRAAQARHLAPNLETREIRGNVGTRLRKLLDNPDFAATILAAAGLERLGFEIDANHRLHGPDAPEGVFAYPLEPSEMIPCVGQGALGVEIRAGDARIEGLCREIECRETVAATRAERAFLRTTGGGCQTPVGAAATVVGDALTLNAISFLGESPRRGRIEGTIQEAESLGRRLAEELRPS